MNFIEKYLDYCQGSEVPDMFYVWSGYATLSTIVGRNVYFRLGRIIYYPNIYTMLVGSAGSGKTLAMDVAKRILEEVTEMASRISMSTETPEGWLRYIAGDPTTSPPTPSPIQSTVMWPTGVSGISHPMMIIANEFINFISNNPIGWITTLNDIYDQDFFGYRTKNKGNDQIIGPCIIVLGALPTETSAELQKANIIASGFARRTIFQYGERKFLEPHAIIDYSEAKVQQRKQLIEYGNVLQKVQGEFTWSKATEEWWTEWYDQNSRSIPERAPHEVNWFNSKPAQLIKIGMLTSLAESFELKLEVKHLQKALDYFAILEEDLYKIFGGIGRNELAAVSVQVIDYLTKQTYPVNMAKLHSLYFKDCKPPYDLPAIINYLVDSEQAVRFQYTEGMGASQKMSTLIGTRESADRFIAAHTLPAPGAV